MNFKKYYKLLELDKVLKMLSEETSCEDAKKLASTLTPKLDLNLVNGLLKETDRAYVIYQKYGSPPFGKIENVDMLLKRASFGGILSMKELLIIANNLKIFRLIKEWEQGCSEKESVINEKFVSVVPNKYLEDRITNCIISEDEMSDSASPELYTMRRKIRSISSKIRDQLNKIIKSPTHQKHLQDPIITIRESRFVVPVKSEYRNEIKGLVHGTSSTGATLFIEPISVIESNNDINMLKSNEKVEIQKILLELSSEVSSFADAILSSYEATVKLNLIFAKATLAYKMKAIYPKLNDTGKVFLKKARHPLIHGNVVPIDIQIGNAFDTLVITGPNTGGKTVSLKTIGLLTLMAMCGLMIPASEYSEVSIFKNILVDIGDEQSIEQSLSTFSSHMINIINIINNADSSSLVLLDELGAGTDPIEGAALATSILEYLKQCKSKIVATTHYAELKSYAISTDKVENACCEFDVSTLSPTYRLLIGTPGKSNAFAISKHLGINDKIISRAQKLIKEENTHFDSIIKSLEEKRSKLEEEKNKIDEIKLDLERTKENYSLKLDQLEVDKKVILENAKVQSEKIVSQARFQALDLIEEISKIKRGAPSVEDKSVLKSKLKSIENIIDPITKEKNLNYVLPRKLKTGDIVLIIDINKKATVLEDQKNSSNILLQAGIIKTRTSLNNLRLLNETNKEKDKTLVHTKIIKNCSTNKFAHEINLRGQTSLEAVIELDKFIDNAVLCGIHQLTVIHGKGTGTLRSEIHKYLKRQSSVRSFRLGVFGEGESGVTIIELK